MRVLKERRGVKKVTAFPSQKASLYVTKTVSGAREFCRVSSQGPWGVVSQSVLSKADGLGKDGGSVVLRDLDLLAYSIGGVVVEDVGVFREGEEFIIPDNKTKGLPVTLTEEEKRNLTKEEKESMVVAELRGGPRTVVEISKGTGLSQAQVRSLLLGMDVEKVRGAWSLQTSGRLL
jgi:hypothetical protein